MAPTLGSPSPASRLSRVTGCRKVRITWLIHLNLLFPEAGLLAGSSTENRNPRVLHPCPGRPPRAADGWGRQGPTLAEGRAKCHGAAV